MSVPHVGLFAVHERGEPQKDLVLNVVPAKALMELFITKDLR